MNNEDYIYGDWTDSNNTVHYVRYKKIWNGHLFTEEENKKLLSGEEISFINKGEIITGHLQGCYFEGKNYLGFKSKKFIKEYDYFPVCKPEFEVSTFVRDLEHEKKIMSEYMHLYYYSQLYNKDKTKLSGYERITEKNIQEEGIDVVFVKDGKKYIVDEKAQMDYIYEEKPRPTFALELLNSKSGREGWFVNPNLKTEYYMFIWPHANEKPLSIDKIEYAQYALVEKKKLVEAVTENYCGPNVLLEYARRMVDEKMGEQVPNKNGKLQGYKFKGDFFDDRAYLFYTVNKKEEPVNLVVKRYWLEDLSIEHGLI